MTNGGCHTALRTRMARSNPSSAQYQREVMGGGAPIGKAKTPPGRSARYTPANSPGRSAGRKCPSAPKLTARSKAQAKGRARTSARTHVASGYARRACASMPALKSTPVIGPWHTDLRTRRPAAVPQHTSNPWPNGPRGENTAPGYFRRQTVRRCTVRKAHTERGQPGGCMREFGVPALTGIPASARLTDTVFRRAGAEPGVVVLRRRTGAGDWQDVTAAEFGAEVTALAGGLMAAGIGPGDRVALMSRTRYEWTLIDYA